MGNEYRELKKQHYLHLLRECERSGMNKREWCFQAGVKYSTFMRWQGILRDELSAEILSVQAIVPVQIQSPQEKTAVTRTSNPEEVNSTIWIEVGEVRIRLPKDISAEYLVDLVKGLS